MLMEFFNIALENITTRKLRSVLTLIGIFIGIAAVFALVSLSEGLQSTVEDTLRNIGTNRVLVVPGGRFFGPGSSEFSTARLYEDDLEEVKDVKGVDHAIGMKMETLKVFYKKDSGFISVVGLPVDADAISFYEAINLFEIDKGRLFKSGDNFKAIVGYNLAYETFDKDLHIGSKIKIDEVTFDVIGIQSKGSGDPFGGISIRVPLDSLRGMLVDEEDYSMIVAKSQDHFLPGDVAENIKKDLRKSRDVDEGEEDFSVQTSEQAISTLYDILNILQIVLVGIAAISLVVGGIGIMNTMYTSVVERTKIIGIFKAIGAKNLHIILIFLFEAGLLGLLGGIIGILLGVGISKIVEVIAIYSGIDNFQSFFGIWLFVGTLLFSFIVGSLAGVLPAIEASKFKPVEALRKR